MMARTDIHLDAMLRHLGAAYYDSLHGRATRTDVARALDTVEDHLAEPAEHHPPEHHPAHPARPARKTGPRAAHRRPGRWKRRVQDVMTTSVVTIDRITPYKEIALLLVEHRISGVPVLTMGRHVAGIVSEADLLAAEDSRARGARQPGHLHLPGHHPTAGEPDRGRADDLPGRHHPSGRADPQRGPADDHASRPAASGC